MGLAASQARLLLLTARKSDLEYRAQQITNAEMILAMQTETVAREYSIKISNQTIKYIDANSQDQTTTDLSASALLGIAGGAYKLQLKAGVDENGNPIWNDWTPKYEQKETGNWIDGNGNVIDQDAYDVLSEADKAKCTKEMKDTSKIVNDKTGPEILEGINNGSMRIVDANGEAISLSSTTGFTQTYYTDDDARAEAQYNTKTASIQVKEKRLQNDLQQVETQQKACDTEIDSVKKVMEKNIERTFKVFS